MLPTCSICGQPVQVDMLEVSSLTADAVASLMRAVAHDACLDARRIAEEQRAAAEVARQADARRQDLEESWKRICPLLMLDTDASRLRKDALASVLSWSAGGQDSGGMILNGKTGRGKTRAMWLLLRREHFAGRRVVGITHTEFSRFATEYAREGAPEVARKARLMRHCDVLFIDDLGKSKFTAQDGTGKAGEELLWDITEGRWNSKLPCMFTCNITGEALAASMSEDRGEPFVRRVREFCKKVTF